MKRMGYNANGGSSYTMIAYGIRSAAIAASVSEHAIEVAVKERALLTRTHAGSRVILATDLHAWLSATPG